MATPTRPLPRLLGAILPSWSLALAIPALLGLGCEGDEPSMVSETGGGGGSFCGDGVVDPAEACDDGNREPDDGCDNKCRAPVCGDGYVQGDEVCDDGNDVDDDACSNSCQLNGICGDSIVSAGEACDDGNASDGDGCSSACALELCGDGVVQSGLDEQCDDGNDVDDDACSNSCQLAPECGNSVVDPGEECDEGWFNTETCDFDCSLPVCGDGLTNYDSGESCDDGNTISDDGCDSACVQEVCGDGIKHADEECDDGDRDNQDECTDQCTFPACGDGILHEALGEVCDDGNDVNVDGCSNACALPVCGDSIVQGALGEACDDGNEVEDDGCTSECEKIGGTVTVYADDEALMVPDNAYNGSLQSMGCHEFEVADDGLETLVDVEVNVALEATWVGDLVIKLESPQGSVLGLLSRPGLDEQADHGFGVSLNGANIEPDTPLHFHDGGTHDAEALGDGLSIDDVVCKDDLKCDYWPNPDTIEGLASFGGFKGEAIAGLWRLCVGDSSAGDPTTLVASELVITRI